MTRPYLAFSFSQLSKFLQHIGETHLAAAYRVLAYMRGTLNQGIYFHDPGAGKRNILSGWVESDFASDVDSRKSVTGYLLSLTVRFRGIETGISEASKRVSIFSFVTQGGKQVSFYFRQGNWVQAQDAQIRFPAG